LTLKKYSVVLLCEFEYHVYITCTLRRIWNILIQVPLKNESVAKQ